MVLVYNDKSYEVTDESMYLDFGIEAESLGEACLIAEELDGMSDYNFNLIDCTNMVVTRRAIIMTEDAITVRIRLREKTELEIVKGELETLREEIKQFASTASKSNAEALSKILNKGDK